MLLGSRLRSCKTSFASTFSLPSSTVIGSIALIAALLFSLPRVHGQGDARAKQLLQSALSVLGPAPISDVVLTGIVNSPLTLSGTPIPATLRAEASGAIKLTYQSSLGPQEEARTVGSDRIWTGNWRDVQGTIHPLANHNLMTEPVWFFPLFALQRALSGANPDLQVTYLGEETFRGAAAQHLRFAVVIAGLPKLQTLSQTELYLDAVTSLPTALVYNDHADTNVLLNIPVTVLFSGYTTLHGILLPAHVQQLRNNALFLDLQIQDMQINTNERISLLQ